MNGRKPDAGAAGTIALGDLTVNRLGFGAMRLTGSGVWEPPKDRAAAHAVLRAITHYDASRIRALAVRFTSPVYPGETVRFQLWPRDSSSYHLRARVDARDVVVLNHGVVELS